MEVAKRDIKLLKGIVSDTTPELETYRRQVQALGDMWERGTITAAEYGRVIKELEGNLSHNVKAREDAAAAEEHAAQAAAKQIAEMQRAESAREKYLADLEREANAATKTAEELRQLQYAELGLSDAQKQAAEAAHARINNAQQQKQVEKQQAEEEKKRQAEQADALKREQQRDEGKRRYLKTLQDELNQLTLTDEQLRKLKYDELGLSEAQRKEAETLHAATEARKKANKEAEESKKIINAELVAPINAELVMAGDASKNLLGNRLSNSLGVTQFVDAAKTAGPAGLAIAGGFAAAAGGAATFAMAARELSTITLDAIKRLDEMADSAQALGISASSFQTLQNAAILADAPAEQLLNALTKMEDILGNPPDEAVATFRAIGVDFAKLQAMSPDKAFAEVARAIDKLPNKSQQIAAMRDIFGKVDVTLLNLIDDFDTFTTDAERFALTDSQFAAIGDADSALKQLDLSWMSVKNTIGSELAPVVVEVAGLMSDFLAEDATQQALLTSLIVVRDTVLSIDDAVAGVSASLDGLDSSGGLNAVLAGIMGSNAQINAAAAEAERLKKERDLQRKQDKEASEEKATQDAIDRAQQKAVAATIKDLDDQIKKADEFDAKLKQIRADVEAFGNDEAKMRQDAIKAGAQDEDQIAAYIALQDELKRLKQAEDDLKAAQQDRAQQAAKDAADYEKMLDKLKTPQEKAADELKRFFELGATPKQLDAMAADMAKQLVKPVSQGPITGVQKGSKEDVALQSQRGREERSLKALEEIRDLTKKSLLKDAVEVVEVVIQ